MTSHRVRGGGLFVLVLLALALHHDLWFWRDRRLVLGVLPVGLAYHALYVLGAAGLMALLVRFAWPMPSDDE